MTEQNATNRPWMTTVLQGAALYNLVWGIWVVLFPAAWFEMIGMQVPAQLYLWQCIGMFVLVWGVGYGVASFDPLRHWPVVLVGLLGKILGPLGFVHAANQGALPWTVIGTIIFNELILLVPFLIIIRRAWQMNRVELSPVTPRSGGFREVLNDTNTSAQLSLLELSNQSPVLLVFLRHFGGTFCRETLDMLTKQRMQITQSGVRIVLVHMVTDYEATQHLRRYGLSDLASIADPQRMLYKQFGLQKGSMRQLFGPKALWRGFVVGVLKGRGVGAAAGDGFQMPGAFLIHRGEIIREFRHRSAADSPHLAELADCAIVPVVK